MLIRPIRSEADHDEALRRVEALWGSTSGTAEGDELDVLVPLIEAYERQHHPIDLPNPIDAIKFRLEQQGQDYRSLIGIIGQRTRVYEVMRGARPLSLNMIRKLHSKLGVPAEVLIQSTRPPKMRAKELPDGPREPDVLDEDEHSEPVRSSWLEFSQSLLKLYLVNLRPPWSRKND